MPTALQPRLKVAVEFPEHFFLESLAVRHDNSLLVTVANRKALYYAPPAGANAEAAPVLLHTFDALCGGIVELEPDVFVILSGNIYTTHDNYAHRLDLRDWTPGKPVSPEQIVAFPRTVLGLNGGCALSSSTLLVADTFGGSIWRLDVHPDGRVATRLWLKHQSMAHIPNTLPPPPQPGINGLRFSAKTHHVCYTTTGQKLFMRVAIDSVDFEPAGEPERLAGGGMYDDFCVDDRRGVAYLTVHRENRIDCAPLEPGGPPLHPIAGDPMDPSLAGPSSAAWSRAQGEEDRVLYVTTDGGHTAPPDGVVRTAKVLRMELA